MGKPKYWPLPYPSFWSSALKIAVPWYPGVRYDEFAAKDYRPGRAILASGGKRISAHRMVGDLL